MTELPAERGLSNNEVTEKFFEEVQDFGSVLRALRENQGFTLQTLSKKTGMPPYVISAIERSNRDLPNELILRDWLKKLGCKDNLNQLMDLARRHRVVHSLRLHSKDDSNADIIRIIELYKTRTLSKLDRDLLSLVGR